MNRRRGFVRWLVRYPLLVVLVAFAILLQGRPSEAQQKRERADAAISAGKRTARILQLRDNFLRITAVRPYLRRQLVARGDDGASTTDKADAAGDKASEAGDKEEKGTALDKKKATASDKKKGASAADKKKKKPTAPDKREAASDKDEAVKDLDDDDKPPTVMTVELRYPHDRLACVDVLCAQLQELPCANQDQVLNIVRACAGNTTADCVKSACGRLGVQGCETLEAAQLVAESCAFNVSGDCLNAGCGFVGDADCDASGISLILDACAGNPGDACVRYVCKRLGPAGCTTVDEFTEVARACGRVY